MLSKGMCMYQYRAFDLKQIPVVGLAILADEESGWRPSKYSYELWGTRLSYQFTTVKLLDYLENQTELENSNNPFSVVTLAHLHAKKTRNQPENRYRVKLHLIRGLYKRGRRNFHPPRQCIVGPRLNHPLNCGTTA